MTMCLAPRRRRRVLLVAFLVPAVAAGCGGGGPSPTTTPAGASPAPVASATLAGCAAASLGVRSPGWGGAAGSRGADVMVENTGSTACSIDGPRVAILDASAAVVLESEGPTETVVLEPGSSTAFSFTFSNWCDPETALPLRVALVSGTDLIAIDGLTAATVDDLPPCNGEDQPPSLSTIPWAQG